MARPIASLPHPSSALVEQVGGILAISREWFLQFTGLVDRVPISGTVAFSVATTAAVTFSTPELDTNYNVLIDLPEDRRAWVTSKTTTGFTLNVSANSSATYGWTLARR